MTIDLALSLSFEGIELLHRQQSGWRRVGKHVDVESATLHDDLAALREKAVALAPHGLATKLIIPGDQIKYTAIDTTLTSDADIAAQLDGVTPYALDDLVIDVERSGGRTHIAAVARETLQEAEAFAAAHGFNPVAFVAIPEPFTFRAEVFFGVTSMMPDILGPTAEVTRDDLPVMIVGTRIKSRLLIFDDVGTESEAGSYRDDLEALLAQEAPSTADETASNVDEAAETSATVAEPEPEAEDPSAAALAASDVEDTPQQHVADTQAVAPAPARQAIWVDAIPAEHHPAPTSDAPLDPPVPVIPVAPVLYRPTLLDTVIGEYHPAGVKPAASAAPVALRAPQRGANARPAAPTAPARTATGQRPANRAPLIAAGIGAAALLIGGLVWSQRPASETAPSSPPIASETATFAPPVPLANPTEMAAIAPAPEALVAPEPLVLGESQDSTPAAPLASPAPQVRIAVTLPDSGFGSDPATPEIASTGWVRPAGYPPAGLSASPADAPIAQVAAPPPPATEDIAPGLATAVPPGRVLSPDEAAAAYAETGVWQRAPRFVDTPSGVMTLAFQAPAALPVPDRPTQPALPAASAFATDLPFGAPAAPPPPDAVFERDENGFILATPEGTVTPEGAVVYAGLPEGINFNPRPELTADDLARMALLAPAPEGVVIVAGAPAVIPPLRPEDADFATQAPAAEAEDATAEAIAAEIAEDAADTPPPGGTGLAGLELQESGAVGLDPSIVENLGEDDPRPRLRPTGLLANVDTGTPDITDVIAEIEAEDATLRFDNSTALAVASSVRPDTRPAGFERVVTAAMRQIAERTVASANAAAATPSAPAPAPAPASAPVVPENFSPVPGGVARAATQEDAIRLREINLIGVYGRPNDRRALVRLANGRYLRVEVGSALDGGQVTAIGDTVLNYVKRGRTYIIELPGT